MKPKKTYKRLALALVTLCTTASFAFGQGHYSGGSFNPGDYFVSPVSGFILPVYYSHSNQNFFNSSGQKSDILIHPNPDDPTTLNMGQNVSTNSALIMAIYAGRKKILKANWGMMLMPLFSSPTANVVLDYYSSNTGSGAKKFSSKSFGMGDLYLQPVWLSWDTRKWAYSFTYGVYIPIGKYKENDVKNIGLGYFSHNIRVAAKYKATPQLSFTMAPTIEINNKQRGVDFTEAPHLTLDAGGFYTFPKGHEIGLYGYYTKQLGNDKGAEGSHFNDRIFGVGAYGSYWFIPGRFSILARVVQNVGARDRFGGVAASIGLNFLFLDTPKE